MNRNLFHTLEGKNICFKTLTTDDARAIHGYASDPEASRFIGWRLMNSLNETTDFIEVMINRELTGTHLYASVALKATHEIIGTAMLFNFDLAANQAEIGYVFHKNYWGKGYGAECAALISDFAFQCLKLHKLHASVVDANIGSARVLEKNGFQLEGRLRDNFFIDGKYYDALLYGWISL